MIFSGTKSLQQLFLSGLVFPGSPTGAEVTGAPEGRKGGKEPTESWMDDGRIQTFLELGKLWKFGAQKKKSQLLKEKNSRAD